MDIAIYKTSVVKQYGHYISTDCVDLHHNLSQNFEIKKMKTLLSSHIYMSVFIKIMLYKNSYLSRGTETYIT